MSDLINRITNAIEAIEKLKAQKTRKTYRTTQQTSQDDDIKQELDDLDHDIERAVNAISGNQITLYRVCSRTEKDDIIFNNRLSENPNTKTESKWFWIGLEEARCFQEKNFAPREKGAYEFIVAVTFSSTASSYIHILDSNLDQCGQAYSISQEHYKFFREAKVIK